MPDARRPTIKKHPACLGSVWVIIIHSGGPFRHFSALAGGSRV